jgi:hypothetical protein
VRIFVIDTYYPAFLREHYGAAAQRARLSYDEQLAALMARFFGTSDSYSTGLRALGHEAAEAIANCVPLQAQWAVEHGVRSAVAKLRPLVEGYGRLAARLPGVSDILYRIVSAQVDEFAPDVVYVQDMGFHTPRQLADLKKRVRLLVGQIASKVPSSSHVRAFDLVTTSFPHFVGRFRRLGVDSEYLRLAFDDRVLDRLCVGPPSSPSGVVFVGGVNPRIHGDRAVLLERLCSELGESVEIYGYGADRLPRTSPIRAAYRGEAWGLDMYRALAYARVALNGHIAAAEGYANNMRLYEATGVGTALLTDRGSNLAELFEPGSEVATYHDADEAAAEARRLLEDEPARARLAAAGQRRTLTEHTFSLRMAELNVMLEERVSLLRDTSR